jgi:hypothetical protein
MGTSILFKEDFELGISAWSPEGGTISRDATISSSGLASMKMIGDNGSPSVAIVSKYGMPWTNMLGIEVHFRFDARLTYLWFLVLRNKEGVSNTVLIRYDRANKRWEWSDDFGVTYSTIATMAYGIYDGATYNLWHRLFLVIDTVNKKGVTLTIDANTYDLSAFTYDDGTITWGDYVQLQFRTYGPNTTQYPIYYDDVKFYDMS